MSDIDPEKLEEAIRAAQNHGPGCHTLSDGNWVSVNAQALYALIDAARAHLATLPRFKEVEVEQWAAFDGCDVHRVFDHEEAAREYANCDLGLVVVRLTGTAKVKVKP